MRLVLSPGSKLGPYDIVAKIGAGGMGEIWRAVDTRLGREVALKVLPEGFVDDPERHARFEREAKVLASLNHPHIATLYGLEHLGGRHALVMELVDGEDLAQRLARGAVPADEAIPIALQIADALESAHEKGIVHRDLKPANIKVTPDGAVKVLDFGLAKAFDPGGVSGPSDPSHSPTLLHSPTITHATQHGLILGTAGYMAPEQARGKPIDKRADIWAFGVVLWEMLAGRRLFDGATTSDVLAAVLRDEPDFHALPAELSGVARHVIARCLEKDPRRRFRDIGDVRLELEMSDRDGPAAAPVPAAAVRPRRASVLIAAGALLLVATGGVLAGRLLRPGPPATGGLRMTLAPPPGVLRLLNPALDPAGTLVVYQGYAEGRSHLYLQRFDEFDPRPLDGTEGASVPFVSPDGRWIGFNRGGRLFKVSPTGGDALALTGGTAQGPGACWGDDGSVVYSSSWLGGLRQVEADGSSDVEITKPDLAHGEKGHWWPQVLPGDRAVLFTVWMAKSGLNDAQVGILDRASGTYRTLLPGSQAFFVRPHYLVYYRAGAYHAVEFDPERLVIKGTPARVLSDCRGLDPAGSEDVSLAVSANGTLAYHPGLAVPESTLVRVDADGTQHPLPFAARSYLSLRLSPDGSRAAVATRANGTHSLWLLDLKRGTDEQVQADGSAWGPVWRPDGKRLAFLSMTHGDFDVYWKDVTGSGAAEPLLATSVDEAPNAFSPDGSQLVFQSSDAEGHYSLWQADLSAGGRRSRLVDLPASDRGSVSPDGRWLAFEASQQGRREIYVQPFPKRGAPVRVSRAGGGRPTWSPAGRTLYWAWQDEIIAVDYHEESGAFVTDTERVAFRIGPTEQAGLQGFDVLPDGRGFVILRQVGGTEAVRLRVVRSWQAELAKALAAGRTGGT